MTQTERKMRVEYFHEMPGVSYGNIMWRGRFPMRSGNFPPDHPASKEMMEAFRQRGYWASRFPEGDGITMQTERGQTPAQVVADIEEVFGWSVVNPLASTGATNE